MRGYFDSKKAMSADFQPVNTFYARDGVYEVRKTPVGIFSSRVKDAAELDTWVEGFHFTLPPIPFSVIQKIIAFFKNYCDKENIYEAMAYIMWEQEKRDYFVYVPKQKVTMDEINAERDNDIAKKYVYVMRIHSHNLGEAVFSDIDDNEEIETMLYAVVGRLDNYLPDITVRYSCGGHYREIPAEMVFENPFGSFPDEWTKGVTIEGESLC